MKHRITKTELKVVTTKDFEVDIPEERKYYWHNGIRKAYCVTPVWTIWNQEQCGKPEEIYMLEVITVDPSDKIMELDQVQVSNINRILDNTKHKLHRLMENLLMKPDEETRTKEQFESDQREVMRWFEAALKNEDGRVLY